MTVIENFDVRTSLGGADYAGSSLSFNAAAGAGTHTVTLDATHKTEGTSAWRIQGTDSQIFLDQGGLGSSTSVDLSAYTSLSVDAYWNGTLSGTNPTLSLFVYDTAYVEFVEQTVTPSAGAQTLTVDLTSNPSLVLTAVYVVIGGMFDDLGHAMDIWVDNLVATASGASVGSGLTTGLKLNRMRLVG